VRGKPGKQPVLPPVLTRTDPGGSGSGVLEITEARAVSVPKIASPNQDGTKDRTGAAEVRCMMSSSGSR
jgi:hypothetical protein